MSYTVRIHLIFWSDLEDLWEIWFIYFVLSCTSWCQPEFCNTCNVLISIHNDLLVRTEFSSHISVVNCDNEDPVRWSPSEKKGKEGSRSSVIHASLWVSWQQTSASKFDLVMQTDLIWRLLYQNKIVCADCFQSDILLDNRAASQMYEMSGLKLCHSCWRRTNGVFLMLSV